MEPITLETATITALFFSEAAKSGGKAFGEGSFKLASQLLEIIRNKFKVAETEGLLTRVEKQPTVSNIDRFKAELLIHIEEDKDFSEQLNELLTSPEAEELICQTGLEDIKVIGNLKVKSLDQEVIGGTTVVQTGARNVEASGDIRVEDINQKRLKS
ncbi:MAG: hypothetical protein AAFY72_07145 [Cyanobacteria bacterium J06649_4]